MAETEDVAPARNSAGPATRQRRNAAAANGGVRRRGRAAAAAHESENIEAQVAQLQADLRSVTTTLGRMGHTATNEIRSTAQRSAQDIADRGQSVIDSAQDEFGAFEKQIKDMIRDKPLTAVAGAVALGFMIAVLTR